MDYYLICIRKLGTGREKLTFNLFYVIQLFVTCSGHWLNIIELFNSFPGFSNFYARNEIELRDELAIFHFRGRFVVPIHVSSLLVCCYNCRE